ncbi:MAG: sigma-70 family RNA polymerase sigma factor [Deltaproteobacteria bacterium]|nr:sigma-70 family RNA polymerase sigma factor [Deltaproteobacteria bacterium]
MIVRGVAGQVEDVVRATTDTPPLAAATEEDPTVDLRTLVETHFDFVWRSLRRLGVEDAALDDAVQQVWVVASRKREAIREGGAPSLLFAIAMRVASDARRAARRRRHVTDDDAVLAALDDAPLPDEYLDRGRARAVLDAMLEELPDDLRAVFVLFELEQATTPEIAELLTLPVGTVASRLRRARELFRAAAQRRVARNGGDR